MPIWNVTYAHFFDQNNLAQRAVTYYMNYMYCFLFSPLSGLSFCSKQLTGNLFIDFEFGSTI